MPTGFIGALDATLHASGEETEDGAGSFMTVEANLYTVTLSVSAASGDPSTVRIETETGHVAASFEVDGTGTQTAQISTGGIPGGRRLRAAWVVPSEAAITFALAVAETA